MSTFTAILTPSPDGTLHLPLPEGWQHRKIKVKAGLELVPTEPTRAKAGLWKDLPGTFWVSPDFDAPLEDFREYME